MRYKIPEEILDWDSLSNAKFVELWDNRKKEELKLSYLFHHDVPFALAGNPRNKERPEHLEEVFIRNAELGVEIPTTEYRKMYSMKGLQEQFNEVIRMQYYYPDTMKLPLACHLYYLEASINQDDNTVHKEIKMMPLIVDMHYVRHNHFIDRLCEKHKDIPESAAIIHWLAGSPEENSRRVLSNYLLEQIQLKYNNIKGYSR